MEKTKIIEAMMVVLQKANGDYAQIHESLKKRRLDWWNQNRDQLQLQGSLPRQAYQLLRLKIDVQPDEMRIIHEDENKIVWHSYNFCPVLEACKRLGLDTRKVCREGYEQSVQDLIACLDPRLKFSRSYEKIRPFAPYCEETIELKND